MAILTWQTCKLRISTDGNSFVTVGGLSEISVSRSFGETARTSYDSGGFTEYDFGVSDKTIDASFNYDDEDEGQSILIASAETRTPLFFVVEEKTGSTMISGRLIVESINLDIGPSSSSTFEVSLLCVPAVSEEPTHDYRFAETGTTVDQISGSKSIHVSRTSDGTYVGSDGLIKISPSSSVTPFRRVARLNHDSITRQCKGLLVERNSRNLITWSNLLLNKNTNLAPVLADNVAISPDGTLNASTMTTTLDGQGVYQGQTVSAGAFYSISVFVKAIDGDYPDPIIYLGCENQSNVWGDNCVLRFNVQDGEFVTLSGPIYDVYREQFSNGWWRIGMTLKAITTGTFNWVLYRSVPGGPSLTFGVWGLQFEDLSRVTSFIYTSSASVTRSADYPTIPIIDMTRRAANAVGGSFVIRTNGLGRTYESNTQTLFRLSDLQPVSFGVTFTDTEQTISLDNIEKIRRGYVAIRSTTIIKDFEGNNPRNFALSIRNDLESDRAFLNDVFTTQQISDSEIRIAFDGQSFLDSYRFFYNLSTTRQPYVVLGTYTSAAEFTNTEITRFTIYGEGLNSAQLEDLTR